MRIAWREKPKISIWIHNFFSFNLQKKKKKKVINQNFKHI